jgi:hypothetical protein
MSGLKKPKKLVIPPTKVRPFTRARTTDELLARLKAEQKKRRQRKVK